MSKPQFFANSPSFPPSIQRHAIGQHVEAFADPYKRAQEQTSYLRSMCHPWDQGTSSILVLESSTSTGSSSSSNVLVPVRTSSHRHSTLRKSGRRLEFCNFPNLFGSTSKQSENRDTKNRDFHGAGCGNKVKVRDEEYDKEGARSRGSVYTRDLGEGLQQLHVRSNALSLGIHPLKRKRRVSLRRGRPMTGRHSTLENLHKQSLGFEEIYKKLFGTFQQYDVECCGYVDADTLTCALHEALDSQPAAVLGQPWTHLITSIVTSCDLHHTGRINYHNAAQCVALFLTEQAGESHQSMTARANQDYCTRTNKNMQTTSENTIKFTKQRD